MSEAGRELEAARQRHRDRSVAARAAIVVAGWSIAVLGVAIVVPLPELGLPLLLLALRLLALRYDWAARAYLPVARFWERLRTLPGWVKVVVGAVGVAVVAALVWWIA